MGKSLAEKLYVLFRGCIFVHYVNRVYDLSDVGLCPDCIVVSNWMLWFFYEVTFFLCRRSVNYVTTWTFESHRLILFKFKNAPDIKNKVL